MIYHQYIKYAEQISLNSCDYNTKIGCLLLDKNIIECFAWNSFPIGISITDERMLDKNKYIIHAEQSLIATCSKAGISTYNKTIVLNSLPPCSDCAKAIITAGITTVVYSCDSIPDKWFEDCEFGLKLLREANIEIINIP